MFTNKRTWSNYHPCNGKGLLIPISHTNGFIAGILVFCRFLRRHRDYRRSGSEITLEQPAKRIIPLYGAFSEILFATGAGEQVIARTQADNFPPELIALPSEGTHMRPNFELIMGLKPDLVIQSATRTEEDPEISRLTDLGIPARSLLRRKLFRISSPSSRGSEFYPATLKAHLFSHRH